MKKKLILLFCITTFLFCNTALFLNAQENEIKLSTQNITWSKVIPGKFICEPVQTSFGFIGITDAKTITAITNNGKLYYEKQVPRVTNPKLSVLSQDFLILSSNDNFFYLINPSGKIIWKQELDSKIIAPSFSGKDGRFFILTKSFLYCFGINGICKWKINHSFNYSENFSLNKISLQQIFEFSDGSLALINETSVVRISPFGKVLQTKTFEQKISNAINHSDGIILSFSNKLLFLDIYEDNLFEKWTTEFYNNVTLTLNNEKNIILAYSKDGSSITFYFLDNENGQIQNEQKITSIKNHNFLNVNYAKNGIFVYSDENGCFFTEDGNILWTGRFPATTNSAAFNYIFFTQDNHLVFCKKNWSIDAYRIFQSFEAKQNQKKQKTNYSNFYDPNVSYFEELYPIKLNDLITSEKTYNLLTVGFYNEQEQNITSRMLELTDFYLLKLQTTNFGTRPKKTIMQKDSIGFNKAISLLSLFGTDTFQQQISQILKKEKDSTIILPILNGIIQNGYDPDYIILSSLEYLSEASQIKNRAVITAICDATLSICTYMGDQAYLSKGKKILTNYMYPNYSKDIRDYARETITKLNNQK